MNPPVPQPGGKPTAAGELTPKQAKVGGFIVLGVAAVLLLCGCGFAINLFSDDGDTTGTAGNVDSVNPLVAEASPSPSPSPTPATKSPSASPSKSKKPPPPPDTDPHFGTCKEAIANGYGPYHQGSDPEYDWYRDADSDGVVCEPSWTEDDNNDDDPPAEPDTDPRFDTCAKANAAGYGPYREGTDPEYDWYQDRDNDGVVCET